MHEKPVAWGDLAYQLGGDQLLAPVLVPTPRVRPLYGRDRQDDGYVTAGDAARFG